MGVKGSKKKKVIGYIETDLQANTPVFVYSKMCVVAKTAAYILAGVKLQGELGQQHPVIKKLGLVLNKDFFVMTRETFIDTTGMQQLNSNTIMLTLNGLRKINSIKCKDQDFSFNKRLLDAISQMQTIENKLFPKSLPETIKMDTLFKQSAISKSESISKTIKNPLPKVPINLREALNKDILDIIVDKVIERIADQALERLLMRA